MYFDWRLFELTRGVRLRILFAAALGLVTVGAGVARLAISGVVIYRVITGQASFSALTLPLLAIAALIVARSVFQKLGQPAVDGRVRLAQDERQLLRFDERHLAEGVKQLFVGKGHALSVAAGTAVVSSRMSAMGRLPTRLSPPSSVVPADIVNGRELS